MAAATIERHRMFERTDHVLVAFSGGADSTALALVLIELGYRVSLGHVDHGLRPESATEAGQCAQVATRLKVPFLMERVAVVPATQAQARRVRYQALERMAWRCGATRIATGHTLNDEAETVRMRLDRGGFGLGIPPVRGKIVRPLLQVRRIGTEAACRGAGILFIEDPANRESGYTRVRVRRELATGPEGEVLRLVALGAAARSAAEQSRLQTERLLECLTSFNDEDGGARIDRRALNELPADQARCLIRAVSQRLGVQPKPRQLDEMMARVLPATGVRLELGSGLSVWSERRVVVFGVWDPGPVRPSVAVAFPGRTEVAGWPIELAAEPVPPAVRSTTRWEETVDADRLGKSLLVRQWLYGDRFHPLGAPGSRKLQDFFVDAGVPRRLRPEVPVIESAGQIVWVAGYRLDDRFKVTQLTSSALRLRIASRAVCTEPV
ncbi:MAG: tRNA lysidine(34) synthetase TilS [Actinomycetota bacterium]